MAAKYTETPDNLHELEAYVSPEINDIKRRFSSNQVFTWEEYYWGTKCIVEYDSEGSNPDLIIKSLKKAFLSEERDRCSRAELSG